MGMVDSCHDRDADDHGKPAGSHLTVGPITPFGDSEAIGQPAASAMIRTGTDFAAGIMLNKLWCESAINGLHSG